MTQLDGGKAWERGYIAAQLNSLKLANIITAAQRNNQMKEQIVPVLTTRATASTVEPLYYTRIFEFMQRHSAYLVCRTTHGWTHATASQ